MRWKIVAVAASGIVLAVVAGSLMMIDSLGLRGPAKPGSELDLTVGGWYEDGWALDVGESFSSFTVIRITEEANGPIRVIAVEPVGHDGDAVTYLGVVIRVNRYPGDQDPAGLYTIAHGYPPEGHQVHRFRAPGDLIVEPPEPGQEHDIYVITGYVTVREGVFRREGVEITYEYQGRLHTAFEPSRLHICVPADHPECAHEED